MRNNNSINVTISQQQHYALFRKRKEKKKKEKSITCDMMHQAVTWGTIVPRGTALCDATMHPPEVHHIE